MTRPALLAATALAVVALAAPAAADPALMTHTEYNAVAEGQTLAKVQAVCGCTGAWNGNQGYHHGSTYKERWFASPVGGAFVEFRKGSDGAWHAGWEKWWCPGDTFTVPVMDQCTAVSWG